MKISGSSSRKRKISLGGLPGGDLPGWAAALLVILLWFAAVGMAGAAVEPSVEEGADESWSHDPWESDPWADAADKGKALADPLEPFNRLFFVINDQLYFYALKPLATGYAKVVPADIRFCVRSFFRNLLAPVRVANHLLQGQLAASGRELARFAINSSIGIGGLVDSASRNFGLEGRNADFGQTLGVYGFGEGLYLHWPILGPSTLRDTVGLVGDGYLNPFSRALMADSGVGAAAHGLRTINTVSLNLGEYERLVDSAFDPYLAVRDAYWQYRRNQVGGWGRSGDVPAVFSQAPGPKVAEAVVGSSDFQARGESPVETALVPVFAGR